MPMIVFVCRANRFRSPLAAACFRKELSRRKIGGDWQVLSAGTAGTGRLPPLYVAMEEADRRGMDLSDHESHGMHAQQMNAASLVIVMEQRQKDELQLEFPECAHKIYMLSEATTGERFDIPDLGPWPSPDEITRTISKLIHEGFDRILALVAQES